MFGTASFTVTSAVATFIPFAVLLLAWHSWTSPRTKNSPSSAYVAGFSCVSAGAVLFVVQQHWWATGPTWLETLSNVGILTCCAGVIFVVIGRGPHRWLLVLVCIFMLGQLIRSGAYLPFLWLLALSPLSLLGALWVRAVRHRLLESRIPLIALLATTVALLTIAATEILYIPMARSWVHLPLIMSGETFESSTLPGWWMVLLALEDRFAVIGIIVGALATIAVGLSCYALLRGRIASVWGILVLSTWTLGISLVLVRIHFVPVFMALTVFLWVTEAGCSRARLQSKGTGQRT